MPTLTSTQRLAQAEDAYHALMTGRAVVVVIDQNGERIEYAKANASALRSYIEALKLEIAGGSSLPSRPMGVFF